MVRIGSVVRQEKTQEFGLLSPMVNGVKFITDNMSTDANNNTCGPKFQLDMPTIEKYQLNASNADSTKAKGSKTIFQNSGTNSTHKNMIQKSTKLNR